MSAEKPLQNNKEIRLLFIGPLLRAWHFLLQYSELSYEARFLLFDTQRGELTYPWSDH